MWTNIFQTIEATLVFLGLGFATMYDIPMLQSLHESPTIDCMYCSRRQSQHSRSGTPCRTLSDFSIRTRKLFTAAEAVSRTPKTTRMGFIPPKVTYCLSAPRSFNSGSCSVGGYCEARFFSLWSSRFSTRCSQLSSSSRGRRFMDENSESIEGLRCV